MSECDEEELEMKSLVGRRVISASINEDKDIVQLETDKGLLYLSWSGDCCAHCFLAHVNNSKALIGAIIIEAKNTEWFGGGHNENYDDITETMGTSIATTKGMVTFETRVEHNGYYSGQIAISEKGPIDNYGSIRTVDELALRPLIDF